MKARDGIRWEWALILSTVSLAATLPASAQPDPVPAPPTKETTAAGKRILSNVPRLGWGKQRETTFCGALESALSVTDHPYDYPTLMGATGLAFRVRWYQGQTDPKWSGATPAGEGPEEIAAARKATGWQLRLPELTGTAEEKQAALAQTIKTSLDAGHPVVTQDTKNQDMAVIYGYEDGGQTFVSTDYNTNAQPVRFPASKASDFSLLPGKRTSALTRKEAFVESLRIAVRNWKREALQNPRGRFWYGDAAYGRWMEDLEKAETFSEADRQTLFRVSWWNLDSLADARQAALTYLRAHADLFTGDSRAALDQAIRKYEEALQPLTITFATRDVFLGPWTGKTIQDWTPEVRQREIRILTKARRLESESIAAFEKALATLPQEKAE